MENINVWTGVIAAVVGGAFMLIAARAARNSDARTKAEAAMWGIGPSIIVEQNKRLEAVELQVQQCWERERECYQRLDAAMLRVSRLESNNGV